MCLRCSIKKQTSFDETKGKKKHPANVIWDEDMILALELGVRFSFNSLYEITISF